MADPSISPEDVLLTVTQYYLQSGDFNGISAVQLTSTHDVSWSSLSEPLRTLLQTDRVGILPEGADVNTHILRTGFPALDKQLATLDVAPSHHTCIYPRPKHLSTVVDRAAFATTPYQLALALGDPQLAFRAFDLSVLEGYRNDPRYHYRTNDVGGQICIASDHYEDESFPEGDKVLLQTFGFAYDASFHRAVAVFLRYLANLTPEHQQIWRVKELTGAYQLHPDYFRTSIIGDFTEGGSVFSAVLSEIKMINELARAMGRQELFRQRIGPEGEDRPRKFGFLVRPTLEEFNNFVHLLDKLLSESIDKAFFGTDIPLETEKARADGKIVVQPKGTIQLLSDWGVQAFPPSQHQRWHRACNAFREVRRIRQRPAHALDENAFDQSYIKKQRYLMVGIYAGLRTIRTMLSEHPSSQGTELKVPGWIEDDRIWVM